MRDIPIDVLWAKTGSMYKLVILASRRALELSDGAAKLTETEPDAKMQEIALAEIRDGRISYKIKEGK